MDQVTGPVIGITLVLMAVFLPTAFLGGITGQLYRQFALTIAITALISAVNAQSGLAALNSTFRAGVPQLFADVDRVKSLAIPLTGVFDTLQAYLGSTYVNDFNLFGRTYQVRAQAEPAFRLTPQDVTRLRVRNAEGQMVPLGTLVDVRETIGPQIINRYNLYRSAAITGEAAPGHSSGQALALMEQMAASKLPQSMGYEWTATSCQEKAVSGEAFLIFGLAVLLVFLVLAAQYESWTNPLAVVLVVPLGLLRRE
jgi:HAE1 family hydrophobic/amphiphilic exporter-1